MSSQDLTVQNGFPIKKIHREYSSPDFDAVVTRYYDMGTQIAKDYNLSSAFQELYTLYVSFRGMNPQAAFDEALRTLDIATPDDFIYYTNEDHG